MRQMTWDLRKRLEPIEPLSQVALYLCIGNCDCLIQEAQYALSGTFGDQADHPSTATRRVTIEVGPHYKELMEVSQQLSVVPLIPESVVYTLKFSALDWKPSVAHFFNRLLANLPLSDQRWLLVIRERQLDPEVRRQLQSLAQQGLSFLEMLCHTPYGPMQMANCLKRYSQSWGLALEPQLLHALQHLPTNQLTELYQYLRNYALGREHHVVTLSDFQLDHAHRTPDFQLWLDWLVKGELERAYAVMFENKTAFQPLLLFIRYFQHLLTQQLKKVSKQPHRRHAVRPLSQALQALLEAEKYLKSKGFGPEASETNSADAVWRQLTQAAFYAGIGFHLSKKVDGL